MSSHVHYLYLLTPTSVLSRSSSINLSNHQVINKLLQGSNKSRPTWLRLSLYSKFTVLNRHDNRCCALCVSHLADLVEGVLSVSSRVFEVVVSWERPVDVPGDGAVLRGLLTTDRQMRMKQVRDSVKAQIHHCVVEPHSCSYQVRTERRFCYMLMLAQK